MDKSARTKLIAKYKSGHKAVANAVKKVPKDKLDAKAGPHDWSARDVIHHLADAEISDSMRLRKLIAETHPVIQAFDEGEYARRLYYDRPIETSLELMRVARESTLQLLERLTDAQWEHVGFHTASGRYSVEDWLNTVADHAYDHAEQITNAAKAKSTTTKKTPAKKAKPAAAKRRKK